MAGYSGTPLPRKLGIREGARVKLSRPPHGLQRVLGDLPAGARFVSSGPADVVVHFAASRAGLLRRFRGLARSFEETGGLWIAWPKRASGVATDLDENVVREIGLGAGLVDNKVCAIDEIWSALRFVVRLADRKTL